MYFWRICRDFWKFIEDMLPGNYKPGKSYRAFPEATGYSGSNVRAVTDSSYPHLVHLRLCKLSRYLYASLRISARISINPLHIGQKFHPIPRWDEWHLNSVIDLFRSTRASFTSAIMLRLYVIAFKKNIDFSNLSSLCWCCLLAVSSCLFCSSNVQTSVLFRCFDQHLLLPVFLFRLSLELLILMKLFNHVFTCPRFFQDLTRLFYH